ncbi:hypothetical protein [Cyanobium sp. ATX 6F1]|uniref:hypothetical protein n=1 Tax=unclassified Cyanobium TaxID=2627006 RepID=UPI0020CC881D|nr:hypothetical protein [Cyanobium sp. ATX 6F1]MCP9915771.1 hypothetical protein [Cyanobium sp. ATX 6F1]
MLEAHPPLLDTLREVRVLSRRINRLLESFGVSDEPPQLSPPGTRSGGSAGGGQE